MAPDLDVQVVRPVPLVERLENFYLMPAETESSGDRHSAIVRMLLYMNTHFLVPESFERTCRGIFSPLAARGARQQPSRMRRISVLSSEYMQFTEISLYRTPDQSTPRTGTPTASSAAPT
jgi:hypothetical protein